MKKAILYSLFAAVGLFLLTQCKNPDIEYSFFSIVHESIDPGIRKVDVSGEYEFLGEVSDMKIRVGLDEQLTDAETHAMIVDRQSFSTMVDNLVPNTLYHYCYVVEFPDGNNYLTETGTFTTLKEVLVKPTVETLPIAPTAFTTTAATCSGKILSEGSSPVTEKGIRFGKTSDLADGIDHTNVIGENEFIYVAEDLTPGTTYYYQAYAVNNVGKSKGEILHFTTKTEGK